jgi:hypothetical protein
MASSTLSRRVSASEPVKFPSNLRVWIESAGGTPELAAGNFAEDAH